MSVSLSNTTPAAPSGNQNVTWQSDGKGKVSGYIPNPPAGGVTSVTGDGVTTDNAASTGAVTLDTSTAAANTVVAGPASGASAKLTRRALVAADIPAAAFAATANPMWFGSFFQQITGFAIAQVIPPTKVSGTGDGVAINYTVPAGLRAIAEIYCVQGDGSDTLTPQVNISGTYYGLGSLGISPNPQPQVMFAPWPSGIGNNIIFEAGDIISVNSLSGTAYVYGVIYTYPNTEPLKWARYITSASTSIGALNAVYTVPAGKHAQIVGTSSAVPGAPQFAVFCQLTTGNIRSWIFRVPSGVTPTGVHMLNAPSSPLNVQAGPTSVIVATLSGILSPGDSISFLPTGINPLSVTSVANAAAGNTAYTGTFTNGAGNTYVGTSFYILGFVNPANNGLYTCTASTATVLTLNNAAGVAETRTCVAGQTSHLLTAAAAGTGVYTGTFLNGASGGGLKGYKVTMSGFTNAANNGTFTVVSSTATNITTNNTSSVAETHAGLCTLINPSLGTLMAFPIQEF